MYILTWPVHQHIHLGGLARTIRRKIAGKSLDNGWSSYRWNIIYKKYNIQKPSRRQHTPVFGSTPHLESSEYGMTPPWSISTYLLHISTWTWTWAWANTEALHATIVSRPLMVVIDNFGNAVSSQTLSIEGRKDYPTEWPIPPHPIPPCPALENPKGDACKR